MSETFSRRTFLQGSALTALAVVSAGLFSGCNTDTSDPYNPVCKGAGELSLLSVTAAMGTYDEKTKKYTAPDITGTTISYPFKITNERDDTLLVSRDRFMVTVSSTDGKTATPYSYYSGDVKFDSLEGNVKSKASVSGTITVTLPTALQDGQSITLIYCPVEKNSEYAMNWVLTKTAASTSTTTSTSTSSSTAS